MPICGLLQKIAFNNVIFKITFYIIEVYRTNFVRREIRKMGRHNTAFLLGRVRQAPQISKEVDTGEYNYGTVYIDIVRGKRHVDDDLHFIKHDYPLIFARDKEIVEQMLDWKVNDVVFVKGTINTRQMSKSSYCPECEDENGNPIKNIYEGNLVYITPIYVNVVKHFEEKQDAIDFIVENREISNQVYVLGTVLKDPKLFTTKRGIQITQYPIALNRKYIVRSDDPSIRTDYPIVKSYGEQAREDKVYLKYQANVIIDGVIQARTVTRKCKCRNCEMIYEWQDHCMELVPYDVEYVSGFKTKEEVEKEVATSVEEYKQMLYTTGFKDELDDELKSEDTKN